MILNNFLVHQNQINCLNVFVLCAQCLMNLDHVMLLFHRHHQHINNGNEVEELLNQNYHKMTGIFFQNKMNKFSSTYVINFSNNNYLPLPIWFRWPLSNQNQLIHLDDHPLQYVQVPFVACTTYSSY